MKKKLLLILCLVLSFAMVGCNNGEKSEEKKEGKVSEAGTLDAVEKEYDLDTSEAMVSEDDWIEIDDIIMDLYESE